MNISVHSTFFLHFFCNVSHKITIIQIYIIFGKTRSSTLLTSTLLALVLYPNEIGST